MSEQIQKLTHKAKQREYEHTQDFPATEVPEDELLALADLALDHIDEVVNDNNL